MTKTASFGVAAEGYGEAVLGRADLTPGTRTVYRSCLSVLQRHWRGLGETAVGEIRAEDCERWFTKRSRMVGASRLKMELAMLKGVLDFAVGEGIIAVNPAAAILGDGAEHRRLSIPTRIEFTRLVRRLEGFGYRDACDMVELLAYSGMNRTEAAGLIWADVDFDGKSFRVRDSRGVCRTVPLFPNMRELLLKIVRRRRKVEPSQTVLRIGHCDHGLRNSCKSAGLPRIHYRGLRHFFALEALKKGVSYPLVAAWLGQKDGGVQVARLYGHVFRIEVESEAAERMTYTAGEEAGMEEMEDWKDGRVG